MGSVLQCFIIASVFFGAGCNIYTGRVEQKRGESSLDAYLKEAESRGIIEGPQALKLQLLAESMHLTVREHQKAAEGLPVEEEEEGKERGKRSSAFMRVYNHLTLLNVLYLSGAVITMGAYSLFMTLAVEKLNYSGMSVVMTVQMVAFGVAGVLAWSTEEYAYVGGILCTICTSMVPFTVYNILRTFKKWPGEDPGNFVGFHMWIRPGWVIMEVATIVVGLGFIWVNGIHFPFLLFPVSFAFWYLSMDLSPLVPGWGVFGHATIRARVSLALGVLIMLAGYIFERKLGSDPDMGFWLYLFGLLTFKFSVFIDFPERDVHGSLYLLTQVALILVGSHLNRTTFHVFGTIGVIEYVASICSNRTSMSNSDLLWLLKALVAAALFSQAVRRGGNIEVLAGIVCLIGFNFNFLSFITSSEFYYLLLLATNLGFAAIPGLFSRPLDLWLFTIPDMQFLLSFVTCILVAVYHLKVLKHIKEHPKSLTDHLFLFYRILMSVAVSVIFVFLRQPCFSWVGGAGIFVVFSCYVEMRQVPKPVKAAAVFFAVLYSLFLQSNLMYLVACLALLVIVLAHLEDKKWEGCVIAVLLVLLSVPLNSKFLIAIGSIYVITYLTHLAYDTFRNSLVFPLVLIVMGLLIIFSAVQYQAVETRLHEAFNSATPDFIKSVLALNLHSFWREGSGLDWYLSISKSQFTTQSIAAYPLNWMLWSGAFTHALVAGRPLYVTYLCAVCIEVLITVAIFLYFRGKMIKNVDEHVLIEEMTFSLSKAPEHESHGLVIDIRGNRATSLEKPVQMALDVPASSYEFWRAAELAFGSFPVSMARSMFLPYKLTPHLISLNWSGEKSAGQSSSVQFSAKVLLGTGHKGSQRMKHGTAISVVKKLLGQGYSGGCEMECVVMYKQAWYQPWSKLCAKSVDLKDVSRAISV